MKRNTVLALVAVALAAAVQCASGLSLSLPEPQIYFPKGYDTNRAQQVLAVLRSNNFKYLGGLTSYWPPEWSTTLVYGGDKQALTNLVESVSQIEGMRVRVTFSQDLSKETGSALQPGSWWVIYSHTMPDTITVRVNLAALGGDKFELTLPKTKS